MIKQLVRVLLIGYCSSFAIAYSNQNRNEVHNSKYNIFEVSFPNQMEYEVESAGDVEIITYYAKKEINIGKLSLKKGAQLKFERTANRYKFNFGSFDFEGLSIITHGPECSRIDKKYEESAYKKGSICGSKTWSSYYDQNNDEELFNLAPKMNFRIIFLRDGAPLKYKDELLPNNSYFMLGPDGKVLYAAKFKSGGCKDFCPVHVKGSIICFDETKKIPCPEGFIPPNDRH